MGLRRFGRLVKWVGGNGRRPFSTSSSSSCDEMMVQQIASGKSLNLYSAINQALHIALETDPRYRIS